MEAKIEQQLEKILPEDLARTFESAYHVFQGKTEHMDDLLKHGVSILTLGQYLRPSAAHLPVSEYVEPAVFAQLAREAYKKGFSAVSSAPYVRRGSSGSSGAGTRVSTAQNRQPRVHASPMIKNVAVPLAKHSPRLGHFADWQTVLTDRSPSRPSTA